MKMRAQIAIVMTFVACICLPTTAGEPDRMIALETREIETVRISLNPRGASLGFESVIEGDDPRLATLIAVIKSAEPGGGHKCPNQGAIRLRVAGGGVIGLGLLPSHSEGVYGFRLYDGDLLLGTYVVQRRAFLSALEDLGVPMDDPAFNE